MKEFLRVLATFTSACALVLFAFAPANADEVAADDVTVAAEETVVSDDAAATHDAFAEPAETPVPEEVLPSTPAPEEAVEAAPVVEAPAPAPDPAVEAPAPAVAPEQPAQEGVQVEEASSLEVDPDGYVRINLYATAYGDEHNRIEPGSIRAVLFNYSSTDSARVEIYTDNILVRQDVVPPLEGVGEVFWLETVCDGVMHNASIVATLPNGFTNAMGVDYYCVADPTDPPTVDPTDPPTHLNWWIGLDDLSSKPAVSTAQSSAVDKKLPNTGAGVGGLFVTSIGLVTMGLGVLVARRRYNS